MRLFHAQRSLAALIAAFLLIPFAVCAKQSGARQQTAAETEFAHTILIYQGYVGQRPEQKANMLALTIDRLERTKKMHADSGVSNPAFVADMNDFGESLLAVRHMTRASDSSKANLENAVRSEMTEACKHADQTTYLDPRLQDSCTKFRKYGYVHMT